MLRSGDLFCIQRISIRWAPDLAAGLHKKCRDVSLSRRSQVSLLLLCKLMLSLMFFSVVHSVVFAFFVPAVVTLLLYWKIYSVAKKREKGLMQGLMMAMGDSFFKECLSVPLRMHCGNSKNSLSQQQQIIRMHKKVAKTLGVVVSAFLFCWVPFFGLYLISK